MGKTKKRKEEENTCFLINRQKKSRHSQLI